MYMPHEPQNHHEYKYYQYTEAEKAGFCNAPDLKCENETVKKEAVVLRSIIVDTTMVKLPQPPTSSKCVALAP